MATTDGKSRKKKDKLLSSHMRLPSCYHLKKKDNYHIHVLGISLGGMKGQVG